MTSFKILFYGYITQTLLHRKRRQSLATKTSQILHRDIIFWKFDRTRIAKADYCCSLCNIEHNYLSVQNPVVRVA